MERWIPVVGLNDSINMNTLSFDSDVVMVERSEMDESWEIIDQIEGMQIIENREDQENQRANQGGNDLLHRRVFSYKDALLSNSKVTLPSNCPAVEPTLKRQPWNPVIIVQKVSFSRPSVPEPIFEDVDEDFYETYMDMKARTAISRVRAVTLLTPSQLAKKAQRIASK